MARALRMSPRLGGDELVESGRTTSEDDMEGPAKVFKAPLIRDYMTAQPITIGASQTLSAAHRLMRDHEIRHLPVLNAGKIVGLVSLRDLHLVETFGDADPEAVPVEDAMTPEPYCVSPQARVESVAREMAEHKFGSAIVVEKDRVVGMFTTIDALRALVDALAPPHAPGRPRAKKAKAAPRSVQ